MKASPKKTEVAEEEKAGDLTTTARNSSRGSTANPFQGHPRFDGMSVEEVRALVREFEADTSVTYEEKAYSTRKRSSYWESVRDNPVSPAVLLAEFYYMSHVGLELLRDTTKESVVSPVQLVMAVLGGIYASSLVTGLGHMLFDNVKLDMVPFDKRPFLQRVALGFHIHHCVQNNWAHQDVLLHGIFLVGTGLVTAGWTVFFALHHFGRCMTFELACGFLAYSVMVTNTQVIHGFAHNSFRKTNPKAHEVFLFLARLGLVLSPKHHHAHHTLFDCNFCITNHWADPVVNGFYRFLLQHGYIDAELHPEIQKGVYIKNKSELDRPFYQMFPDWRYVKEHGDGLTG